MAARRVTLGRVAGVYGVRGWVRIASQTRPPEKILDYADWWLVREGREDRIKVLEGQVHGRGVIVQLGDEGGMPLTDRDTAAELVGASIEVDRGDLPKLPKGQYYWVDLIGLDVRNTADVALGTVTDVTSNGAQDVLVVRDGDAERLIPFVRPNIVREVDPELGRIVCDWEPDY
ncbi:MAG: ribosome maturation factor RimM [Nevskiales bacterium]|nr:ribosome maturation factor RimM [Nevskiales bacterium]